jgi:hypothetical protein
MKRQKVLETILVLVLFQVALFWYSREIFLLYLAFLFGLVGLTMPFLANKIHFVWMKFSHAIGYIMSRLLLTVIFFLLLFPISLLSKVFAKRKKSMERGMRSYFVERNFTYTAESLKNVW